MQNGLQQRETVGGRNNEEVPKVQSQDCSEGLAGAYVRVYDGGDKNRKRVNLNLNRPPLNTGEREAQAEALSGTHFIVSWERV